MVDIFSSIHMWFASLFGSNTEKDTPDSKLDPVTLEVVQSTPARPQEGSASATPPDPIS